MIGLDTNVLVRYLTQDDPVQGEAAANLIESRCTREEPGYIALIVLCELVWVLRGAYRYDRTQIVDVLEKILHAAEIQVENEDAAWYAMQCWLTGASDFADSLIVYVNELAGCETTYTFDEKLARNRKAQLVP